MADYNIGSDTKLTIVSNGVVLASQILTEFDFQQMTAQLDSTGLDGVNRYDDIEKGWHGTLTYDRADSSIDAYFAAKEAGRYAGQKQPRVYITQNDTNVDGSVSIFRFERVTMTLQDGGRRTGDTKVTQRVAWRASKRVQVQ